MHRTAARLVGQQERRSELRGHRTVGEHVGDVGSRHQAARRDDGHDRSDDHRVQQLVERLCRRLRDGIEGAAMAARRGPLRGEHVDTAGDRLPRPPSSVVTVATVSMPSAAQAGALLGVGQAEGERHDVGPQVHDDFELRRPLRRRRTRASPSCT